MRLSRELSKGDLKQIGVGWGRRTDRERGLVNEFVNVTDLQVTNTIWIQRITCN